MKLKYIVTKKEGQEILSFIHGHVEFVLFEAFKTNGKKQEILLFHGYDKKKNNKILANDLKSMATEETLFLSCYGNLFPEWVKSRSVMPRDTEIFLAIQKNESFDLLIVKDE